MSKINKKWFLVLAWMCLIFFMSHQVGEVSSNQSKLVIEIFSWLGINLDSYFGELATLIVRKGAHFTEYLILASLVYNALEINQEKKRYIIAFIITVLYACSDEIHQYFVPGRAMALKDVLIDSSGAFFGLLIILIYSSIRKHKKVI